MTVAMQEGLVCKSSSPSMKDDISSSKAMDKDGRGSEVEHSTEKEDEMDDPVNIKIVKLHLR